MRSRTVRVLLACLGLSVAATGTTATAQTTSTSSTSTSTTSSPTTSTTTAAATSTTHPHPCTGQVCTESPPAAFLSGRNGEVALDRGSFCWMSPTPMRPGVCVDMMAREAEAELLVQAGETLTLRFEAMSPTAVSLQRGDTSTALTPGNPMRFVADLPVGRHEVMIFTRWLQGDASYAVRLVVRRATTPTTGVRISLTG